MSVQSSVRPESPAECALRMVRTIRGAVPCDGAALVVMDPVTRLFSTGAVDELPEPSCHPFFTWELSEASRTFRRMALDRAPATRLDAAGSPHDPLVRTVLVPHGFGAEVRAVCGDGQAVWGGVTLWRAAGSSPFGATDVALLDRLSGKAGVALREAVVGSLDSPASGDVAPAGALGVLLVQDGQVTESSPGAAAALREHGHPRADEYRHLEHLRALASGPLPFTTVLRTAGGWVTAHGTALGADRVAITLSAAGPDRLLGARVVAAGLTPREVEVTRLICRGLSDREIARELGVTGHTAHDHVRSVRRKLGVRSRAEVSATIFADRWFGGFLATAEVTHAG